MSSHREAPAISKDPVADNTDTYAFVTPDDPGTVTIISNYLPLEAPFGGPNFYEFGDDVRYAINIDNDGDGAPEITYEFLFKTKVRNPETFLYNTGPIDSIDSPNWNRRQFYTVTRVKTATARCWRAAWPARRATSARARRRTTRRSRRRRSTRSAAAARCSPGSVSRASTSTSARYSTWATCGRSRTCTWSRWPQAHGVNATHDFSVHTIALKIPIARADPRRLQAERPDGGQSR